MFIPVQLMNKHLTDKKKNQILLSLCSFLTLYLKTLANYAPDLESPMYIKSIISTFLQK